MSVGTARIAQAEEGRQGTVSEERALTVTEAMNAAKRALESVSLRVIGEVSEFNDKPGYKAAYFTVCDGAASMPCLMWRDVYVASGIELRCGALVELTGAFSAYVPKGRMQFVVRSLALAGEGFLRMQVAALARKLESEGLMSPDRKRALPTFPGRIAVVTSPRGKAVHDVIRTLRRRYPLAELMVAGVQVEGTDAPAAIVEGMRVADAASPDVILLVRGGGSYEDLMPFNAEEVARAVAASRAPVVTGIGHEPDTSISDMVSDLSVSTPTAAAEACAPSVDDVAGRLEKLSRLLGGALAHRVQVARHGLRRLLERPVFADSRVVLGPAAQTVDTLGGELRRAIPERLRRDRERLTYVRKSLAGVGPRLVSHPRDLMAVASARLGDLSPLGILGRGYAVCYGPDGRTVVKSVDSIATGEKVNVRVADGRLGCVVETAEREI